MDNSLRKYMWHQAHMVSQVSSTKSSSLHIRKAPCAGPSCSLLVSLIETGIIWDMYFLEELRKFTFRLLQHRKLIFLKCYILLNICSLLLLYPFFFSEARWEKRESEKKRKSPWFYKCEVILNLNRGIWPRVSPSEITPRYLGSLLFPILRDTQARCYQCVNHSVKGCGRVWWISVQSR